MAIDWSFICSMEGAAQLNGYVPEAGHSHSGVTIASGVDLGQRTGEEIMSLPLSADLKRRLCPYAGLKKEKAVQYLASHPLEITPEDADALDQAVRLPLVSNLARQYNAALAGSPNCTSFEKLPGGIQTAIASVAFQYGLNLAFSTPHFWNQITIQDWVACARELENFGDNYPSRRRVEAALIRKAISAD